MNQSPRQDAVKTRTSNDPQARRRRSSRRRRRRNRQSKQLITAIIIFSLLLIAAVGFLIFTGNSDELKGTWDVDGITSYEFNGNGKGALVLPSSRYDFRYEIDDRMISIDFRDEKANDVTYEFTVTDDLLTLSINSDFGESVEFTLHKTSN